MFVKFCSFPGSLTQKVKPLLKECLIAEMLFFFRLVLTIFTLKKKKIFRERVDEIFKKNDKIKIKVLNL